MNTGFWETFSCQGQGVEGFLDLLAQLPITARVLGNWEDSLWHGVRKELDSTRPSQRYLLRQCQYVLEEIFPRRN